MLYCSVATVGRGDLSCGDVQGLCYGLCQGLCYGPFFMVYVMCTFCVQAAEMSAEAKRLRAQLRGIEQLKNQLVAKAAGGGCWRGRGGHLLIGLC
jgi:hypothetical protein